MAERVAVVTGASSGIGLAAARQLLEEGYRVVGVGRDRRRLDEALGDRVMALELDVSDAGAVADGVATIGRTLGRIDALVNCAGIVTRSALVDTDQSDLQRIIAINLMGTIHCTRHCIALLTRQGGSIVNLSSTLAVRPVANIAAYATTKAGIEGFTRAMAVELAPDRVRVNAVAPAMVASPIWRSAGLSEADCAALAQARARDYPLGRIGEPEEIAAMIGYLLSDQAGWITGSIITMDGGSSVAA